MKLLMTAKGRSIPKLWLPCFILLLTAAFAQAQQKRITGLIRNASTGQPVENVSIVVKGTNRGTTSNTQGSYSITVTEGETLVFSALGLNTLEQRAGSGALLDINLTVAQQKDLDAVVVTALGITRKQKALGYSVTELSGDEVTDARSNNWSNALTGKVAGLNLLKSGGGPAGSSKIILRGENALGGNSEALLVVDGVIMSSSSGRQTGTGSGAYLASDSPTDFGTTINDINPDDIETISVLKGPGAAALYGYRGANGAIIITTKSGKPVKKGLGLTFNSNYALETINRWPDFQYEYGQGAAGQDTWYSYGATVDGASTRSTSSSWGPRFDGQSYFQYDPVTRTGTTTRVPWVPYKNARKEYFNNANTFTNTLTLEGGTAGTSARISFTNLKNKWIIPNTGYDRNTVALSVNQKVSDKLQVASKINYTNRKSDNLPSTGYNNQTIMYFIRGLTPNMNMDWFKDYWVPGQEQIAQTRPFSSLLDNPYLQAYEMLNASNRNGVVGNVSATYSIIKDLNILVRSSLDFSYEARSQRRPKGTQKFVDGMYRTQNIYNYELTNDFLIRYNRNFTKNFNANFSAGGSATKNKYIRDELRADKLLYPGVYTFANSKNVPVAFPFRSQYAINSFYGLVQFSYKNFLFLDATARNDWASTLATPTSLGKVSFFYPSVNGSAILSDIFRLPSTISYLKLRASWAKVGSGGTTAYRTAYVYETTLYPSGLSNPTVLPNPDLGPLSTISREAGIDVRLFKNRLEFDVALYQNNTYDQIANIPVDRASGASATVQNNGEVRNRGIEIQANGSPVKRNKGFNWTVFGTFANNSNRVIALAPGTDVFQLSAGPANRGSIQAKVGGTLGDLYGIGYRMAPDGQVIYDAQGYPVYTDTIKYLGRTNPKYKASFRNEFRYKNFSFSFLFDGQWGGVGYSLTTAVLSEEGKLTRTVPGRYNGIIGDGVQDNKDGTYRKNDVMATSIQGYYNAHFNRDNVQSNTFSTDFIKFREARLDYSVPAGVLKKLKLQRATIGVFGRDLFVMTNWPAYDPEFGTLGDGDINAGFEIGQFPSTRTMGVNLTIGL